MLGMIWAQGHSRAIGRDGTMAWHIPEDMGMFKRVTMGHPVVMGRRTWESIEDRFRPLPGRDNYVVTRQADYEAPGAVVVGSIAEAHRLACEKAGGDTLVWIMGGAQIYAAAMDEAEALVVTDLDLGVEDADAFAPPIDYDWRVVQAEPERGWLTSKSGVPYRFTAYRRPGSSFGEDGNPLHLGGEPREAQGI